MSEKVKSLRDLEAELTDDQQRAALEAVRRSGWPVEDPFGVPLWVWRQAFAFAALPAPSKEG